MSMNRTREGIELVHQSLRMHPTQRMAANQKLTGNVADDDRVEQESVRMDAGPDGSASRR